MYKNRKFIGIVMTVCFIFSLFIFSTVATAADNETRETVSTVSFDPSYDIPAGIGSDHRTDDRYAEHHERLEIPKVKYDLKDLMTNTAAYDIALGVDVDSDGYDDNDFDKLQAFLNQPSSMGSSNGALLDASYDENDPATWSYVFWDDSVPKRVVAIDWFETGGLAGSLDVSDFSALQYLDFSGSWDVGNQITALNVSNDTNLYALYCEYNVLSSLDISSNTALEYLMCYDNQITSLDVSANTALTDLDCGSNALTTMDVSSNTDLLWLLCWGNSISSLNISANTALRGLDCGSNPLTTLDVSNNTSLERLYCYFNQLTSLDVSANTALSSLDCAYNMLTSLDLSNNPQLDALFCEGNAIAVLDVTENPQITVLVCGGEPLTHLQAVIDGGSIQLQSDGNGYIAVELWDYDPIFTATGLPQAGYGFENWTSSGTPVSTNATIDLTIGSSYDLVANFAEPELVTVDNVGDLISSIGSNKIITLQPGNYDLGEATDSTNPNVWYESADFPEGATVSNVSNLTIKAETSGTVLLHSSTATDNVLVLDNCSGITFEKITLGHSVAPEAVCSAGVFYLSNCSDMTFNQCDVYGCGTVGYTIDQSYEIVVVDTTIRDCVYGAAWLYDSYVVIFDNVLVENNGNDYEYGSALFDVNDSELIMGNSTILNNGIVGNGDPMFSTYGSSYLYLWNCTASGNQYAQIHPDVLTVQFDSQGGSTVASKIVSADTCITSPETPVRAGYAFGGWYEEPTCVNAWDFNTEVTANMTLYAKWEEGDSIYYCTHVQNIGWQDWKSDGEIAGTEGQALRLEGIKIEVEGMSNSIQYKTHVQNIGWQNWAADGAMSGTEGQALRLEAIEIQLTGTMTEQYDVYYRVHAENFGWMDWAKNGAPAGTAGYGYRLEAIQIVLVEKGGTAPGSTTTPYRDSSKTGTWLAYRTHVQNVGWQDWVSDGAMSGTEGQALRLEGINIMANGAEGSIQYKTHVQNIGWQDWVSDGELSGTTGLAYRLEAIQIQLSGTVASQYDIYYRVHAQNFGWMDWACNGASAGTAGFGYRLEGIEIVLVEKGGAAPGPTDTPFVSSS